MVISVGVVGGGLCGLATTWHLCSFPEVTRVVVYDDWCRGGVARGDGDGFFKTASSVAAGLLHPLTPRLKVAWEGDSALSAADELLAAAEHRARADVLIRPCRDARDSDEVRSIAQSLGPRYLEWLEPEVLDELTRESYGSHVENFGGVRIVGGKVVDVSGYLASLWKAIESHKIRPEWCEEHVDDLRTLRSEHDVVVCCGGAAAAAAYEERGVRALTQTYSQSLVVPNFFTAQEAAPALLRGDYLCPAASNGLVIGSTRDPFDPSRQRTVIESVSTVSTRLAPAISLAANLKDRDLAAVAKTTAGIRLNGPRTHTGRLPFVGVRDGIVLAGGLGSRGLLRHSQVGRLAAIAAVNGDDNHVPGPLRPKFSSFVRSSSVSFMLLSLFVLMTNHS